MNTYEREYFVSRLRSGIYFIKLNGVKIKVLPPTIEDEYLANEVFQESYDQALMDDIFTEDEMWEWMAERGLWSQEKDDKIKGIEKDIENMKAGMFNERFNPALVKQTRRLLRNAEIAKNRLVNEKHELFGKTCEGLATQHKALAIFEKCCYVGSELLDCDDIDVTSLYYEYNRKLLSETQLRDLARNDPWRLAWLMKDQAPLFANHGDRQLTNDQKGILIWSNMYDNIQESMECPSEDVIEDDDMLDGWFIIQRKKADSEKAKIELEKKTNAKIANSDEIHIMAGSKREADQIHSMNSVHADRVRKQRLATVKRKGTATDLDFKDVRIELGNQQHQNFKESQGRQ